MNASLKVPKCEKFDRSDFPDFPDAYAEHTHQFLPRMLSMRTSSLRVCSACASVPDASAQRTHKRRSIRVRK